MKKVFERWQKALLVFVCCMLLRYPVKQIMMMLPIRGEAAAMVLTALQALLVWGLPSIIIRPR